MKKDLLKISLVALLSMSVTAFAGTRDLVFEDDEEPVTTSPDTETLAIATTVELKRDGETKNVNTNEEFKSGDKVKLKFTSKTDGYVYWLAKGTSGNYSVLYPNEQAGIDNAIKRIVEYTVPAKGSFKFDSTPGSEELLCIVASEKIADLERGIQDGLKDMTALNNITSDQEQKKKSGTRDLVFEDDEEEDVSVATQTAPKGEPLVMKYVLKHN